MRYALTQDTMSSKFQNKYSIPSARWQSWDYSSEGLYFITINTVQHECLFGNIVDKEMYLSAYGQIVAEEWNKSFEIRTGLFCDAFVIMPNHIHAILRIEYPVETHSCASDDHVANNFDVETHSCAFYLIIIQLRRTAVRLYRVMTITARQYGVPAMVMAWHFVNRNRYHHLLVVLNRLLLRA